MRHASTSNSRSSVSSIAASRTRSHWYRSSLGSGGRNFSGSAASSSPRCSRGVPESHDLLVRGHGGVDDPSDPELHVLPDQVLLGPRQRQGDAADVFEVDGHEDRRTHGPASGPDRRNRYHCGAVLFIGHPSPSVCAGSTATSVHSRKAAFTSSREALPIKDRNGVTPQANISNVASGSARAETPRPTARRASALRRLDGRSHLVDSRGLPTSARKLRRVLTTPAPEVERPTQRARACGLLAVQQGGDARRRRLCVALPGSDPQPLHERVVLHVNSRARLPWSSQRRVGTMHSSTWRGLPSWARLSS
jgi:hypothetical protein